MEGKDINSKKFIVPFLSLIAFFVITGGLSYAYYAFVSTSGAQTAFMNTSFPARAAMCSVSKTDCAISLANDATNRAKFSAANCSNTVPVATSACYLNVTVTGSAGSTCTVTLNTFNNGTGGYTKSNTSITTKEYSYTVQTRTYQDAGPYVVAVNEKQWAAGDLAWADSTYGVTTTTQGGSRTREYRIIIAIYNVCGINQNALTNAFTGKTYQTKFGVKTLTGSYA